MPPSPRSASPHHLHLCLALLLILMSAACASSQPQDAQQPQPSAAESPAAQPTPADLDEARRQRELDEAAYYRAQTEKLNKPDEQKSFWRTLSDNAAILGALTAAFVALITLIVNRRTVLRAQQDTQFYEALKRFGDKDSPTLRSSAAGLLALMGTDTRITYLKWGREYTWRRLFLKLRHRPYYFTALDQLCTGLLLEENPVVFISIGDAFAQLISRDYTAAGNRLWRANMSLHTHLAQAAAELTAARGLELDSWQEPADAWKEATSLATYDHLVLAELMVFHSSIVRSSFDKERQAVAGRDDEGKAAHVLAAQQKVQMIAQRLRVCADLCEFLLQTRPPHSGPRILHGIFLAETNLTEANFEGVELRGAKLQHTYMDRVDLRAADLQYARLEGARLNHARLTGTKLYGAGADIRTEWYGANWWQADFSKTVEVEGPGGQSQTQMRIEEHLLEMLLVRVGGRLKPEELAEAHESVKSYLEENREHIDSLVKMEQMGFECTKDA